jgi:hypothetical protein
VRRAAARRRGGRRREGVAQRRFASSHGFAAWGQRLVKQRRLSTALNRPAPSLRPSKRPRDALHALCMRVLSGPGSRDSSLAGSARDRAAGSPLAARGAAGKRRCSDGSGSGSSGGDDDDEEGHYSSRRSDRSTPGDVELVDFMAPGTPTTTARFTSESMRRRLRSSSADALAGAAAAAGADGRGGSGSGSSSGSGCVPGPAGMAGGGGGLGGALRGAAAAGALEPSMRRVASQPALMGRRDSGGQQGPAGPSSGPSPAALQCAKRTPSMTAMNGRVAAAWGGSIDLLGRAKPVAPGSPGRPPLGRKASDKQA